MKFRELLPEERNRVNQFYKSTTYKRPVSERDRVFAAEEAGLIFGALRIESRDSVQVLRGMYMRPDHVRKGIGSQLLYSIEPILAQSDSYCIPLGHLLDFYGKVGFRHIQSETAPPFLAERLDGYLQEGKDVVIMFRPATS